MKYNFDKIIDRSGTHTMKHGVLEERFGRSDLLALWVADMDFETPPFITEALKARMEHSLFGYTLIPDELWTTIIDWVDSHHQWKVEREWLSFIPGIVKGIGMAINVFVKEDEKVIIQPPVYHPFRLVPEGNYREVVNNPLVLDDATGQYSMNLKQLEEQAKDPKCRMLILSVPHNPAGIVWDKETLARVAEICYDNNVLVISDEIHCDMALFGYKHIPFATVSDKAAQCSITFAAPSKTFNIAGIVSSYSVVPNKEIREKFYNWMVANELNDPTLFSPIATIAAFKHGEEWRQQMLEYVTGNILFLEDYIQKHIPGIKVMRPQASFLVWLDCRGLNLNHDELNDLFINKAHLALNDGEMFGKEGAGFMRINVGAPRAVLHEALDRLVAAIG
ncbi:MAG: PatB family C-S lyase [Prevotella sp.]|nr:PatB family C-S lyase [Prevotella sp.]